MYAWRTNSTEKLIIESHQAVCTPNHYSLICSINEWPLNVKITCDKYANLNNPYHNVDKAMCQQPIFAILAYTLLRHTYVQREFQKKNCSKQITLITTLIRAFLRSHNVEMSSKCNAIMWIVGVWTVFRCCFFLFCQRNGMNK